ncbi:efflux transporter outer membrane subunit [Allosphingosinicella deserti]|uniref:efflux transporter outer membrane subunit n=1 Tax=Allosphingosinicella deserti TaxID=2116704 RepID=UPI001304AB4F|nr:efflux transporter outer membrane subunit [Sphingomonas deserti]
MRLSLLLSVSLLAGCTVGSDYHPPSAALTPAYHAAGLSPLGETERDWWRAFGDPKLEALVSRALAQNLDIEAAAARVAQARGAAHGSDVASLPRLDATASAETVRQSLETPVGRVADRLTLPRSYELYQVGVQAAWEIDLFGGLRRGRQAARADLEAAAADAGAVQVSVAAETADAYFQLRGLQARLALATEQLQTERTLLDLVRQKVEQGIVANRELNRLIGEEQGLQAALSPLRAAAAGQLARLDVLIGAQAGTDPLDLGSSSNIADAPPPDGSSNPADLMRRRADIRAAEHRLAAANARIGIAIAEHYPRVSFGGLIGVVSLGMSNLFTDGAVQASGGAGLRWRLFDFGRVDAEVAQARGREAEALALYRATLLRATGEVETALVRYVEGGSEIAARQREVAALRAARDQARQAYAGGVLALIDVLDADRALLVAQDRLVMAKAETARASVAAVRALGGGWLEERS